MLPNFHPFPFPVLKVGIQGSEEAAGEGAVFPLLLSPVLLITVAVVDPLSKAE